MPDLKDLAAEIDRCSQCNFCLAACPVYREDRLESSGARGRINLVKAALLDQTLPVSGRVRELIDRCLLCTNCVQTCPASIRVDDIVAAARANLPNRNPAERMLLRRLLDRRAVSGVVGSLLKGLNLFNLPSLANPPLQQRLPAAVRPDGPVSARVAYFVGCGVNYLYPDTGEALVKVFSANGVEVVIPAGQQCCGLPALARGDKEMAREAVRANAALFAPLDVDAVVTDCTSCGYMLKVQVTALLPPDDPALPAAQAVAGRIVEATEFLAALGLQRQPRTQAVTVTYHVPCHRHWSAALADAPPKIAALVPGARFVPLREPRRCCGAGGAFFLSHRELSASIRGPKIEDIVATGAQVVLTQCPACRYFLQEGLGTESGVRVMHPLAFLAGGC
ncbi:MAG: (Fe-S)-binding protein [Peptococcaceae bacterium]|jgi:glycolate oxidase iron-sulfur subunit|nr:(Fe-S)-binding protein [Peptococcaceae bacterium]